MPAVRVRATSGWQDLTLQGAPGRSGGWQEIGYVEGIPDITVSGTSAVPTMILTLPALIFDGATTIELEFWARSVVPAAAANAYIAWAVWQDGVMLGVNAPFFQLPSGGGSAPAHLKTRIKPSAGSHTYSIRAWQVGGNGTMVGGQSPGCMMFFSAKIVQPQGMGPPLVTTLPSNPLDGQEVYYLADAVNGVIWHLRYRTASASAYKWEVVGGSELASIWTSDNYTVSIYGTYFQPGGAVRGVTVPLAGDYDAYAQMTWQMNTTGNVDCHTAIFRGGTKVSSDQAAWGQLTSQYSKAVLVTRERLLAVPASTVLEVRGMVNRPGGTETFYQSHAEFICYPVRVG